MQQCATAFGLQTRGLTLSDASYACLDEEFAADPGAEDGYIEATVRELRDRPRVMTETLMRAGVILNSCLTEDEKQAL